MFKTLNLNYYKKISLKVRIVIIIRLYLQHFLKYNGIRNISLKDIFIVIIHIILWSLMFL